MSQLTLPSPHINEEPRNIVWSKGEFDTTIGDIPELAGFLNSLAKQMEAFKTSGGKDSLENTPDRQLEFEILPIGQGEARELVNSDGTNDVRVRGQREDTVDLLYHLKEKHGNGSEVVEVHPKERDDKTAERRFSPYLAVIIKDGEGEVEAVVADTYEEDNAIYVLRPKISNSIWERLLAGGKDQARAEGARRVYHVGDIERIGERVAALLSMSNDEYLEEWAKPTNNRKRAR